MLAIATAALLAATVAQTGDHDVVPGERLGNIKIGMPLTDVQAALGEPLGEAVRRDGLTEAWWFGGRSGPQAVRVLFERNRVVQVSATSRAYRTADGLSTAVVARAIARPGLRRTAWRRRGSGGQTSYYDDVARGLAWSVTGTGIPTEDDETAVLTNAVIVHAKNRPVAIDDDLLAGDAGAGGCAPEVPGSCGD